MKHEKIALVLGMFAAMAGPALGEEPASIWRADYDAARKESVEKGRPVCMVVFSDACLHCRRLETGPLRDPAIVALLSERFIPVRVDAATSPKLIEALGIQLYPTVIIASADGRVLTELQGYQDAKTITDHLKKAAPSAVTAADDQTNRARHMLAQMHEAIKVEDYACALELCQVLESTYQDSNEAKQARGLADDIRAHPSKLARACEQVNERLATMYTTLGDAWIKNGNKDEAAECYEKAVRTSPASTIARDAQAKLANLKAPVTQSRR